jgi:hypothetical protein
MDTITFADHATMLAQAQSLEAAGWTCYPCDDSDRGVIGYLLCRDVPGGEETTCLEWLPFGAVETEITTISAWHDAGRRSPPDLLADLTTALAWFPDKKTYRADDPKSREVGFVTYENGIAHVLRIALTVLKENPKVGDLDLYEFWRAVPDLRKEVLSA